MQSDEINPNDHVVKMANGVVALCEQFEYHRHHSIQITLCGLFKRISRKKANRNLFDDGVGDADESISGKCVHALETIKIKLAVEC